MWYVVQVRSGTEDRIVRQCQNVIDAGVLERCFVPYYEEWKKYHGTWHTEKRILFPGYVFMVSSQLTALHKSLQGVIGMTRLLGTGNEIVPLREEEIGLLQKMGVGEMPMKVSEGMIENDTVVITEGPLTGMEGFIRRIDRHKRKAWLDIDMLGRTMRIEAGLEIIEKK